jgi:predicted ABC-type transport system involved in lysophospholipase L1 biosynthesis ATPase subunit
MGAEIWVKVGDPAPVDRSADLRFMASSRRAIVRVTHDPRAAQRAKRTLRLVDGAIVSEE